MVMYHGHPEYLDEHRAAEYTFEVSRNFAQNVMLIKRARTHERLALTSIKKFFPVSSRRWHRMSETWVVFPILIGNAARKAKLTGLPTTLPYCQFFRSSGAHRVLRRRFEHFCDTLKYHDLPVPRSRRTALVHLGQFWMAHRSPHFARLRLAQPIVSVGFLQEIRVMVFDGRYKGRCLHSESSHQVAHPNTTGVFEGCLFTLSTSSRRDCVVSMRAPQISRNTTRVE